MHKGSFASELYFFDIISLLKEYFQKLLVVLMLLLQKNKKMTWLNDIYIFPDPSFIGRPEVSFEIVDRKLMPAMRLKNNISKQVTSGSKG